MKLRIKGNSLRIRVSQTELARFAERGLVEDRIEFGGGRRLRYGLRVKAGGPMEVEFAGDRIALSIPRELAESWTGTERVSLRGEQALPEGALKLLVEKDFQCLTEREDEDESDLFAHPGAPG